VRSRVRQGKDEDVDINSPDLKNPKGPSNEKAKRIALLIAEAKGASGKQAAKQEVHDKRRAEGAQLDAGGEALKRHIVDLKDVVDKKLDRAKDGQTNFVSEVTGLLVRYQNRSTEIGLAVVCLVAFLALASYLLPTVSNSPPPDAVSAWGRGLEMPANLDSQLKHPDMEPSDDVGRSETESRAGAPEHERSALNPEGIPPGLPADNVTSVANIVIGDKVLEGGSNSSRSAENRSLIPSNHDAGSHVNRSDHAKEIFEDLTGECDTWMPQFNVMDYGAKGDRVKNDTAAILFALQRARESGSSTATVLLPQGFSFLSWPLRLVSNTRMCIQGNLVALSMESWQHDGLLGCPKLVLASYSNLTNYADPCAQDYPSEDEARMQSLAFLRMENAVGVHLGGQGTIEGRGSEWWSARKNSSALQAPVLVLLKFCTNCSIKDLHLKNSPFHGIAIVESVNVNISHVSVNSEVPSAKNTGDGVSILNSKQVHVKGCYIAVGDSQVGLRRGSSNITVEDSMFARGLGITIGSFGLGKSEGFISNVIFRKIGFNTTFFVARIITVSGASGYIRNVEFEDLVFHNVKFTPLGIDQYFCPQKQLQVKKGKRDRHAGSPVSNVSLCPVSSAAVQIEDVSYLDIKGTSRGQAAYDMKCSASVPCTKIVFANVTIQHTPDKKVKNIPIRRKAPKHDKSVGVFPQRSTCQSISGTSVSVTPPMCFGTQIALQSESNTGVKTSGTQAVQNASNVETTQMVNASLVKESAEHAPKMESIGTSPLVASPLAATVQTQIDTSAEYRPDSSAESTRPDFPGVSIVIEGDNSTTQSKYSPQRVTNSTGVQVGQVEVEEVNPPSDPPQLNATGISIVIEGDNSTTQAKYSPQRLTNNTGVQVAQVEVEKVDPPSNPLQLNATGVDKLEMSSTTNGNEKNVQENTTNSTVI